MDCAFLLSFEVTKGLFSRDKGEFGFKASLVGIDESATICQAKQAGCVAPAKRFDPTAGNRNVVSCRNVRNPNLSDACDGASICIQGTKYCSVGRLESGVCIDRGRGVYMCGQCSNWGSDF